MIKSRTDYYGAIDYSTSSDKYGTTTSQSWNGTSRRVTVLNVYTTSGKPNKPSINNFRYSKLATGPHLRFRRSDGFYHGSGSYQSFRDHSAPQIIPMYDTPQLGSFANWGLLAGHAYQKALDKARGAHANVSVDAFEAGKTVEMLRKAVSFKKLIREFVTEVISSRKYKRIRGKSARADERRTQYISSKWLEYRYGWMPLLSSIFDVADALRKRRVAGETRIIARESQQISMARTASEYGILERRTDECSYQYQLMLWFDLPSDGGIQDFTNLNPLSLAWELTPFSFVADWFVNIGSYLENWENYYTFRNRYKRGCNTYRVLERRANNTESGYVKSIQYLPNGYAVDQKYKEKMVAFSSARFTSHTRNFIGSLPVPPRPHVKLDLKSKQLLDVAALIRQQVNRR